MLMALVPENADSHVLSTETDRLLLTGLTARGFTYFQFAGWFGYYGYPNSARPWQNKQLWDWSRCCNMDVTYNKFFGLVSALFGYTVSHQPQTPLPVDSNLFAFTTHKMASLLGRVISTMPRGSEVARI